VMSGTMSCFSSQFYDPWFLLCLYLHISITTRVTFMERYFFLSLSPSLSVCLV
jgi:hypothetical protein